MGIYDVGSSGALSDVLRAEQKEKHILTIKFPHPFFLLCNRTLLLDFGEYNHSL